MRRLSISFHCYCCCYCCKCCSRCCCCRGLRSAAAVATATASASWSVAAFQKKKKFQKVAAQFHLREIAAPGVATSLWHNSRRCRCHSHSRCRCRRRLQLQRRRRLWKVERKLSFWAFAQQLLQLLPIDVKNDFSETLNCAMRIWKYPKVSLLLYLWEMHR